MGNKLGLVPLPKAEVTLRLVGRDDAGEQLDRAAKELERCFSIRFETLVVFSGDTLRQLHAPESLDNLGGALIRIVSNEQPIVARLISKLTTIANNPLEEASRREYFDILLGIYSRLDLRADQIAENDDVLVVGIEREGRILAEKLGCLPPRRGMRPQAKRIQFEDGLVVGISGAAHAGREQRKCVIIDGAIASGATLIAMLEHLRSSCGAFAIYSAHATFEGLRAISRYSESKSLDVEITVGHATEGLNSHYYAVMLNEPEKVVVGDLGDTISPLS